MIVEENVESVELASEIKTTLKEVFGFNQFRGTQEVIINNILAGKNTFVIMPTGAGKSLCYQLPALVQPGTAIVISPLIALMKNQVDSLNAVGVNAQFLNSTLTKTEMNRVKKEVLSGDVKLLYVAPESLTKEDNVNFLKSANISFVAIDEAHCISEWGHDFRPEYRRIKTIVGMLGNLPIIALTATATPKVQQDIQKNLQMEDAAVFKSSFRRNNLFYDVRPKVDTRKQLVKFVKKHHGKSGIIYCLSRKKVEEIAELLRANGVKALPYHAGLDPQTRMKNQDAFLSEDADVICATIAFGMGIDKPDVRFVVHYDAPKSLEGYYQETGRAGRDGLQSDCLMFFSYADIDKLDKFNKDKAVTERENAKYLLQEMIDFADSSICRVRQLLHYFGEYMDGNCGYCDNCQKPNEKYVIEDEAKWAIQAVIDTDERFGISHIVDYLSGIKSEYIESYGHYKIAGFGLGKNKGTDTVPVNKYWYTLIRQITVFGFLTKDIENFGTLKVTEKGHKYLNGAFPITLHKDHDYTQTEKDADDDEVEREQFMGKAYDGELFELLKGLRKKIAKEKGVPTYVVFQDPSMEEMATVYPTTMQELMQITGVGAGKANKFGKPFVDLIKKYVEENDITTGEDIVIKSAAGKSQKVAIIKQIDLKMNLEDVARSKGISYSELLTDIENICYSGTKLNLDYYIDELLDDDRQDEIYEYFMAADTDDIQMAHDSFDGEYTEEELRLMRVKFMSELAN